MFWIWFDYRGRLIAQRSPRPWPSYMEEGSRASSGLKAPAEFSQHKSHGSSEKLNAKGNEIEDPERRYQSIVPKELETKARISWKSLAKTYAGGSRKSPADTGSTIMTNAEL